MLNINFANFKIIGIVKVSLENYRKFSNTLQTMKIYYKYYIQKRVLYLLKKYKKFL